ncbi:MAG TPA: DUF2142 domain-containing protein, partial [Polyangia bacterium]|nr:DUF2142 domain-containing protein [Polyangia bacterium]
MLRALYRRQPLTPLHWSWLVAIFVAQLVYATVLPMFEGPDEIGHYYRMWALSRGHFACDTVPESVTTTAHSMLRKSGKQSVFAPPEHWRDYLKRGAAIAADDTRVSGWGYECFYFPSGLLAQALANRIVAEHLDGKMRTGGAFIGAYAARAAEAVVVDLALLFALVSLPRGRFTLLAFFSIPEVIQQSSCINHDAFLFVLTLLIAVAALARPSWRVVLAIGVMASLMAAVKPVYALFGLCGLPQLAQLWTREHRFSWWRWLVSLTLLLPLTTYYLLRKFTVDANRLWHPSFANPELQWTLLKHHPLRLFKIFVGYFHYFIDDHKQPDFYPRLINGKWTTLLAGTAQFDMALPGLIAVIAGLILAIVADLYSQPPIATTPAPSARVAWAWRIANAAVVATIPLTIVALYLIFSHVGADYPYGVQGRYHLFTLLL